MKRLILAASCVLLLLLAGCDDPHKGQVCAQYRQTTILIPVVVGKVTTFTPVITNACVEWVTPTEAPS